MSGSNLANLDLRLKCPFTMMVSGPSSSGKSTFVKELVLRRSVLYNEKPGKVFWFYKVYQDMYNEMIQLGIVDEFVEGMCTMDWLKENSTENCTVIIDDMALEVTDDTAKLFSIGSHHHKANIIFISQNLFSKNNYFRDISLNSTYHIIFKNPRDKSSIKNFAKQFAPGQTKEFAKIFTQATKQPHSYLMIDYHQKTMEDLRIISNYLQESNNPIQIFKLN